MVDIGGYVIVLVEQRGKIKLYGSPADRSDCDEILEINGSTLENQSHQEIIDFIHECIKSRTICLRVKRRNSDKLASDSSPIDAFIIGNRAREHFEKIIQSDSITPRDIAQLSKLFSDSELNSVSRNQGGESEGCTGTGEHEPLSATSSSTQTTVTDDISTTTTTTNRGDSTTSTASDLIVITSSQSKCSDSVASVSVSNLSAVQQQYTKVLASESGYSGSTSKSTPPPLTTDDITTTSTSNSNKVTHSDSNNNNHSSKMELVEMNNSVSHHSNNNNHHNNHNHNHNNNSYSLHHRELPVDVPDTFVGVVKQTPRYPPPHPPPQPPQRYSSILQQQQQQQTQDLVHSLHNHLLNSQQQQQQLALSGRVNSEKLRKYSDEIHRKKDEEEFLRTSLRGSKKLQQLKQEQRKMSASGNNNNNGGSGYAGEPMVNVAFEPDDEVLVAYNNNNNNNITIVNTYGAAAGLGLGLGVRPERESDKVLPLPYLESIVENVQNSLNAETKELIERSKLKHLVAIYSVLMQHQHAKVNSYLDGQQQQQNSLRPPSYNSLTRHQQQQHQQLPPTSPFDHHQPNQHHPLLSSSTLINGNGTSLPSSSSSSAFQVNAESSDLLQEVILMLQHNPLNSHAAELLEILTRVEVEGLCAAYDHVLIDSNKTMATFSSPDDTLNEEKLHEMELDSMTAAAAAAQAAQAAAAHAGVKVVQIEKSTCEPLGATVRNEADGSVIIGRIIKGGAAHKSGMLHEGDEILEVNNIEMKGRNVNQVCDLLAEMTGTLTFVIALRDTMMLANPLLLPAASSPLPPPPTPPHQISQVFHLRALFDYDPDEDLYIPCRELGICFNKGDVLHVIDQSDTNWWQAYREGDNDQSLAGLIPSIQFQLQREAMKQSILNDSTVNTSTLNRKGRSFVNGGGGGGIGGVGTGGTAKSKSASLLFNCGKRSLTRGGKKKNSKYQRFIVSPDEILTYEEVYFYHPRPNFKRPIVLIGPANIGRHELRQRLMQDNERFAAAVPHTSRPRKDGEFDGIDYHFISRQMFEHDIKEGRFVEHGEYEKNYYGTSFASIEAVVQSGKICILNLHVHSVPLLRQGQAGAKLKPFFVFVTPPAQPESLHRLLALKQQQQSAAAGGPNGGDNGSNAFCLADFQATLDEAAEIEAKYGHYFDMVLQMTEIERSYQELLGEINALEHEPQWIPSVWVK